jgi:hypothetical protein
MQALYPYRSDFQLLCSSLKVYSLKQRQTNQNQQLTCVPIIVITQVALASLQYTFFPDPGIANCVQVSKHTNTIIIFVFVFLVCSETCWCPFPSPFFSAPYILVNLVIVILTMIKAVRRFRLLHTGWILQLYRDGLLFYIYLFCLSLLSILLPLLISIVYLDMLAVLLRALHSILCTRVLFVIFHLRCTDDLNKSISKKSEP